MTIIRYSLYRLGSQTQTEKLLPDPRPLHLAHCACLCHPSLPRHLWQVWLGAKWNIMHHWLLAWKLPELQSIHPLPGHLCLHAAHLHHVSVHQAPHHYASLPLRLFLFLRSVAQIQTKEATLKWSLVFTEHQAAITKVVSYTIFTSYKSLFIDLWVVVYHPDSLLDPVRHPGAVDHHPPPRVPQHLLHGPPLCQLQGMLVLEHPSHLTCNIHSLHQFWMLCWCGGTSPGSWQPTSTWRTGGRGHPHRSCLTMCWRWTRSQRGRKEHPSLLEGAKNLIATISMLCIIIVCIEYIVFVHQNILSQIL